MDIIALFFFVCAVSAFSNIETEQYNFGSIQIRINSPLHLQLRMSLMGAPGTTATNA